MSNQENTKIRAVITGTTGMVGEGVLHECLLDSQVEAVLIINRKPLGMSHPKLKEIIHQDFFDFSAIKDQLSGYNACFFCLGISSVKVKAQEYYKLTYTLTLHVAQTLAALNPDMTFCYVSGAGTDSTETGWQNWARVKGKTENDLFKLPFKKVFAFRPGYIHPTKGLKNAIKFYQYIGWLYPIGRRLFPGSFCSLSEVGKAMIGAAKSGYPKQILEGKDIVALAKRG